MAETRKLVRVSGILGILACILASITIVFWAATLLIGGFNWFFHSANDIFWTAVLSTVLLFVLYLSAKILVTVAENRIKGEHLDPNEADYFENIRKVVNGSLVLIVFATVCSFFIWFLGWAVSVLGD